MSECSGASSQILQPSPKQLRERVVQVIPKYKLAFSLLLVSGNLFLFAIALNNQQYKVLCGGFFSF